MEIINKHWMEGGTFVTNFEAEDRPLYEAAIKEYGDADLLICDEPVLPPNTIPPYEMHSLHLLRDMEDEGLSNFWRIVDEMKKGKAA